MNFELLTGERRISKLESIRTWIYYIAPDGRQKPLTSTAALKQIHINSSETFSGGRELNQEFMVMDTDVVLKFETSKSNWGRPNALSQALIQLNDRAELIEVKGIGGFGIFKGRAKCNLLGGNFQRPKGSVNEITIKRLKPAETSEDASDCGVFF